MSELSLPRSRFTTLNAAVSLHLVQCDPRFCPCMNACVTVKDVNDSPGFKSLCSGVEPLVQSETRCHARSGATLTRTLDIFRTLSTLTLVNPTSMISQVTRHSLMVISFIGLHNVRFSDSSSSNMTNPLSRRHMKAATDQDGPSAIATTEQMRVRRILYLSCGAIGVDSLLCHFIVPGAKMRPLTRLTTETSRMSR